MASYAEKNYTPTFLAIHQLVRQWAEAVGETEFAGSYSDGCEVGDVENRSRDGFIAFTDGGVELVIPADLSSCDSSGSAPSMIDPYLASARSDCEKEWDEQNPGHPVAWIYAAESDAQGDLLGKSRERERWREKFCEFEDEHMREGGTFFYKIRALYHDADNSDNESGEPEVLFCVGVNTDFEYGRDSIPWLRCYGQPTQQTHWVWEATVKVRDIAPELIEQLAEDAASALDDA